MCLDQLGRHDQARGYFYKLVNYGKNHLFDSVRMDYFAVSLPDLLIWEDDLDLRNVIHCNYMMALGYLGLGEHDKAAKLVAELQQLDINHLGVLVLSR